MQKGHRNSYLSFNELIYHSAIVGFVGGFIEMLYGFYQVYSTQLDEADDTLLIFLYLEPITDIVSYIIYAVMAAAITYPIYKKLALRRGGLTIVLNTIYENKENT